MIKTLEQINREFMEMHRTAALEAAISAPYIEPEKHSETFTSVVLPSIQKTVTLPMPPSLVLKEREASKKKKVKVILKRISDIVFYLAIFMIVITTLIYHVNPDTEYFLFSYLIKNSGYIYLVLGGIMITAILVSKIFAKKRDAI